MTVSNAGADVVFVCKGGGSQVVMEEQGGSRASDQVFELGQVVEKTIEEAHATCTPFLYIYYKAIYLKRCHVFAEELLICNITCFINKLWLTIHYGCFCLQVYLHMYIIGSSSILIPQNYIGV